MFKSVLILHCLKKLTKLLLKIRIFKIIFTVLTADKIFLPEEPSVVQPDITLRRILLGQPFSLEKYKSLVSKTALLDAALASGDGNAILIVSSTFFLITNKRYSIFTKKKKKQKTKDSNIFFPHLSIFIVKQVEHF